jgi:hypothetical protein
MCKTYNGQLFTYKLRIVFLQDLKMGRSTLDTLFYTPDYGDLPDFDLPDELELPNIAEVA